MLLHRHLPTRPAAPWRGAALGVCAGLAFATVWGAPARWLDGGLRWLTHERVQLHDARGTVWSGSAMLTLTGGPGSRDARSLPTRITWRLQWTWPGLSLTLSSACCTPSPLQWHVSMGWNRVEMTWPDPSSTWPMALLTGLGAPWNTLQAEGQLQWKNTGLHLRWLAGQLHWHGQSELQLHQVTSRLSMLRPMGSYRLTLQGTDLGTHTPQLTLSTLAGPLQLSGQGQWQQRLRFTGQAMAEPGHEEALSNLLNLLGQRNGARTRLSLE